MRTCQRWFVPSKLPCLNRCSGYSLSRLLKVNSRRISMDHNDDHVRLWTTASIQSSNLNIWFAEHQCSSSLLDARSPLLASIDSYMHISYFEADWMQKLNEMIQRIMLLI
ncbi:hypothetical protein AVEN_168741-1 [Araneus ventricosus]|uniref:Uncharacterized protein n=1 Tax=Araneus ventricosus TaxID=182803 RepID=A0A4Y1ZKK1_ARAVE|nr:hypothetical protein AVEN_168741-1 [Araneus ventricosus]